MNDVNETTLKSLKEQAIRAFPHTRARQHLVPKVKIVGKPVLFANPKSRKVITTAEATSGEDIYRVVISASDVQMRDTKLAGWVRINGPKNQPVFIRPLNFRRRDVNIRCSCGDFRWRFNYYDHKDKSLFGQPAPKYIAKVRPGSANPTKSPGACKHVMAFMQWLDRKGLASINTPTPPEKITTQLMRTPTKKTNIGSVVKSIMQVAKRLDNESR